MDDAFAQLDLFAFPARPAPPPRAPEPPPPAPAFDPLSLLPVRPITWQRLLARATTSELRLLVSRLWTGLVVETLSDPALGRHFLHADGVIQPIDFPDSAYSRTVILTADQVLAIHQRAPLVRLGGGSLSAMLRFAAPGEPGCTQPLEGLA